MSKSVHWGGQPSTLWPVDRARRAAAWALRRAALALVRLARALGPPVAELLPGDAPVLEFYAEAGAPEGALYVDGVRVGVLEGVTRL